MTTVPDLARRISGLAGGLGVALALACGLVWGHRDAVGALLGSGLTVLNFGALAWAAERATGRPESPPGGRGRALWIGASGLRLGAVGAVVMAALALGGVGSTGLLLSLPLVPAAVVLAGLTAARAS